MVLRFSIFGNPYYFTFKFVGLTLIFVLLFSSLGAWQYQRAQEKRLLFAAFALRQSKEPIIFSQLFEKNRDSRFYTIHLTGHFDNKHHIFLDNKTQDGQVGYEVYTPFLVEKTKQAILVDRGFLPANPDRRILPTIQTLEARISLQGIVNEAPRYFSLGSLAEESQRSFPLRVQYIKLAELAPLLGLSLPPYIVWLDPADKHGFSRRWKITLMGPEKHLLYTVQWFAFALSLLVIFGVLNLHRVEK